MAITKYKKTYCARAIELGKKGNSRVQIAAQIGVGARTLDAWAKKYPEFGVALDEAVTYAQAWWEDIGQKSLGNRDFNANHWTKVMQARFRGDYTQHQKVEHSGSIDVKNEANQAKGKLAKMLGLNQASGTKKDDT